MVKASWNELGTVISKDRIRTLLKSAFFSYTTVGIGTEAALNNVVASQSL